jgi:ssDNA-binding replication factor A large subunit
MAKEVKIWYDSEGDYLEVIFERKESYQADFLFWLISDFSSWVY